jgi:hypothetical protein
MKYIYHHLGLGDHIICNGLVRTIINKNEEYKMFVKSHNLTTVTSMYRDLKNLSFLVGDDNYAKNYIVENKLNRDNLIVAGFYRHPDAKGFDESFYMQNNIPFENRWKNFYVERDLKSEKELFNKFNVVENEYIFIHDDYTRNYNVNQDKIINKDLPIIRPKIGLTDNVFDYCYLMEHSVESHFIDSSFRLIFDSLKLRKTNIFYHINMLNEVKRNNDLFNDSTSQLEYTVFN